MCKLLRLPGSISTDQTMLLVSSPLYWDRLLQTSTSSISSIRIGDSLNCSEDKWTPPPSYTQISELYL